jgi:Protein of unknown function, DUF481
MQFLSNYKAKLFKTAIFAYKRHISFEKIKPKTMKLKLLLVFLTCFYLNTKAQQTPSDTLQPINNPTMPTDSTAEEESSDDEEAIDEEDKKNDALAKFRYRFSTDGTITSGNVSRTLIQFASGLDWNLNKVFKLSSSPSYIYGEQNKVLAEKEVFADLRATILQERKLYYLAFTSFERSNLRKINNRFVGAGGIGLKLVQKKAVYISITNVLLYEKTDFVINEKFPDRNLWRNSTRLFGEYTFDKGKMSLSHTLYVQPSITEKNFRWNGNIILKYQVSKNVSFRSMMENSYESIVVPGRKNNDFRWTFGVVLEGKK